EQWPLRDAKGNKLGLYAAGVDNQVLVSAQAAFLPVSASGGRAIFKPHLYSYQSALDEEHGPQPRVLTLMISPNGTSVAIAGKAKRDEYGAGGAYGETLFFNDAGQRMPLTAERANTSTVEAAKDGSSFSGADSNTAGQLDRVLIVQVPLIPQHPPTFRSMMRTLVFDVENAVHGPIEGPFDETMGSSWKRDTKYPVRMTVQLYKPTSDGVVDAETMADIKREIDNVYADARAKRLGSLL
ncbi:MAG: hypothetical protein H7Z43_11140, partial [Clostridia bacterium]|nr:hypothetical protein [Deltaproteobacteria bacterium]